MARPRPTAFPDATQPYVAPAIPHLLHRFPAPHGGAIVAAVCFLSGDRLLSGGLDRCLRIHSAVPPYRLLATLRGHTGIVTAVASLDDGGFVSASMDHSLRLWSATMPYTCVGLLAGHQGAVNAVALLGRDWAGEAREAASVCTCQACYSASQTCPRVASSGAGNDAAAHNIPMLVSVSWDRTARVHLLEPPYNTLAVCEGHEDGILAVTALRDGRAAFATGGADGTVRVWACPPTFAPLALLKAHAPCAVRALAALPNEGFVSGGSDGTLHLWHARDESKSHAAAAASAGLARDNAANNDKGRANDQSPTFVCQTILKGPPDATVAVATAHHAMILLAGSLGHRLQVWRVRHPAWNKHAAPERERCLSSSDNVDSEGLPHKRVRLPRPDDSESVGGDCLAALEAHQECVFSVAVTPCGTRALSGGFDSAMALWDLEVCAQLCRRLAIGQARRRPARACD